MQKLMRSACRTIMLNKRVTKKVRLSQAWRRFAERNPMNQRENDCYNLFANRKAKNI